MTIQPPQLTREVRGDAHKAEVHLTSAAILAAQIAPQ